MELVENYMVRPVREEKPEPKEWNLFADPDYLFDLAADLARERAILNEYDWREDR